MVGCGGGEGNIPGFLVTLMGETNSLFRPLFSVDFLSTAAGVEFSEPLPQEGEEKRQARARERRKRRKRQRR